MLDAPFIWRSAEPRRERHWIPERRFWITRGTSKWPRWRFLGEWETIYSGYGTPNQGPIYTCLSRGPTGLRLWSCTTWKNSSVSEYPWYSSFICLKDRGQIPVSSNITDIQDLTPVIRSRKNIFDRSCELYLRTIPKHEKPNYYLFSRVWANKTP